MSPRPREVVRCSCHPDLHFIGRPPAPACGAPESRRRPMLVCFIVPVPTSDPSAPHVRILTRAVSQSFRV